MRGGAAAVLALVAWRLLLSRLVRTAFDPDEYWQGPEVAHRLVFGCVRSVSVHGTRASSMPLRLYSLPRSHSGSAAACSCHVEARSDS